MLEPWINKSWNHINAASWKYYFSLIVLFYFCLPAHSILCRCAANVGHVCRSRWLAIALCAVLCWPSKRRRRSAFRAQYYQSRFTSHFHLSFFFFSISNSWLRLHFWQNRLLQAQGSTSEKVPSLHEREMKAMVAKAGVRRRRGPHMQVTIMSSIKSLYLQTPYCFNVWTVVENTTTSADTAKPLGVHILGRYRHPQPCPNVHKLQLLQC